MNMDNVNDIKNVKSSDSDSRKLVRAGDVIVIILLLAAVFAVYMFSSAQAQNAPAQTAEVTFNGEVIGGISLSDEGEYSYPQLPGMKFTVSEGKICVSESNCSDKICVRSGWLSRSGESAVCVPNKAAVTVRGSGQENNGVDAVVK